MDFRLLRRILPIIAISYVAMLPMESTPFLILGAEHGAKLTAEQADWVGTACVFAVAIGSILAAPLLHRAPFQKLMAACALLEIAAFGALSLSGSPGSALVLATLAGLGAGGLIGGMATLVAGLPDPDMAYGYIYAVTGLAFAGLLFALPAVEQTAGPAAMFLLIAGSGLLASPALFWIAEPGGEAHNAIGLAPAPMRDVGLVALAMTIAFPVYGGVYGLAERKAAEVGLSAIQAGATLSGATLLTILGAVLVAFVGTRLGRTRPTCLVMLLATIAYALTLGAQSPARYVPGLLLFGFVQLALNSYFFGLASALDRSGRWAAALQGYSLIPYALGPGLFGSLLHGGKLSSLAWPAVGVNLLGLALLSPVLIRLERGPLSEDFAATPADRLASHAPARHSSFGGT